jgi:leader peptidase (prepilin peptidase)/N-methyltransferase
MNLADYLAATGSIYLFAVAWPLSKIDIREHRLPNKLVLPAFPITLFCFLVASVVSSSWVKFYSAIAASIIAFCLGLLVNKYFSLGMGDVKLISATTLCLAWSNFLSPILAMVLGLVIASLFILLKLIRGRTTLGDAIALGPYLLAGFVCTQILTWSSCFGGCTPNFLM